MAISFSPFRRLPPGQHEVRYRVQVLSKQKLVYQTNWSPSRQFEVSRRR